MMTNDGHEFLLMLLDAVLPNHRPLKALAYLAS
jgi:hypothetical protein